MNTLIEGYKPIYKAIIWKKPVKCSDDPVTKMFLCHADISTNHSLLMPVFVNENNKGVTVSSELIPEKLVSFQFKENRFRFEYESIILIIRKIQK